MGYIELIYPNRHGEAWLRNGTYIRVENDECRSLNNHQHYGSTFFVHDSYRVPQLDFRNPQNDVGNLLGPCST